jgi:Pyrimidine dimer DNA glycosylase
MNIFFLSTDPREAAEFMVDRHVVKMILESAQLLSTAHRVLDGEEYVGKSKTGRNQKRWKINDARDSILYGATHINHPSAVWVRQSVENYCWLVEHLFALADEYTYRYGKRHNTITNLGYQIQSPPFALKDWDFTTPPSAMAPEYIVGDDPVENYRNYYKAGKSHLHTWTRRQKPNWL